MSGNKPDFIAKVEDRASPDPDGLTRVGAAWYFREGDGVNVVWDEDERARQLVYESDRLVLMPYDLRSTGAGRRRKITKRKRVGSKRKPTPS